MKRRLFWRLVYKRIAFCELAGFDPYMANKRAKAGILQNRLTRRNRKKENCKKIKASNKFIEGFEYRREE